MSQRELLDWYRFEAFTELLPDRLADLQNALLCSLVVNLVRSSDAQPVRPADFFVIRDPTPPPPVVAKSDTISEAERQRRIWRGG